MGPRRFLAPCALLLALLLSSAGCAHDVGSSGGGDGARAVDDLVARWWNWAAAPEPGDPVSDRDGSSCAVGQSGVHTLRIVARADDFALDVTYQLTVGSPAGG